MNLNRLLDLSGEWMYRAVVVDEGAVMDGSEASQPAVPETDLRGVCLAQTFDVCGAGRCDTGEEVGGVCGGDGREGFRSDDTIFLETE